MIKIICSDITVFKSSFEAVSKIVTEVQLEIDSDGIRLNAIDPSHITFVHLELEKDCFDIFECTKPSKISFVTDEFLKYLKRIGKDSLLELGVDANYLIIRAEGRTNKTFKLKLLDIENNVPNLPEIEYPNKFMMDTKLFKEVCLDIVEFSHKLQIYNEGSVVYFEAFGDFTDAKIEYDSNQKLSEDCSSVYDLEKIKDMLKADKFATQTSVSFGDNLPLLLEMSNDEETQRLNFLLAPRIEDEY